MKHHWLNPTIQRSLDVLGLVELDDGTFLLGREALTRTQALELVELLNAGVRIDDLFQARAFVLSLASPELERLTQAVLERGRTRADVVLYLVRSVMAAELGDELYAQLGERATVLRAKRNARPA